MEEKLMSMVDFILDIDWLTTTEFCTRYNIPLPEPKRTDGKFDVDKTVNDILRVDAIKHKMFVDYAKFLNRVLTIDMFEGASAIFKSGVYFPSTESNWGNYCVGSLVVFRDSNVRKNGSIGLKVGDLVGQNLTFKKRNEHYV